MTPVEAAHRLGVHETAVRTVEEREADCVVTLRGGRRMLVSDTVARAYVPEVDDTEALEATNRADREKVLSYAAEPDEKPKPAVAPKTATKRTGADKAA